MGFLDSLSKTLSSGVDRAKYEADKFQRTSRISGEINNIKSQVDTNIRQLGERALELYEAGAITAPEVTSLAQIIAQLREQLTSKDGELQTAQNETFEVWQAQQLQQPSGSQNVPISNEPSGVAPSVPIESSYAAPSSADMGGASGGQLPPSGGSGQPATGGYSVPSATGSSDGRTYEIPESSDLSGSGMANSSSVGGDTANATTCPNCGYVVPANAAFCPNCGNRVRTA